MVVVSEASIEDKFGDVMDRLQELRVASAQVSMARRKEVESLRAELEIAKMELAELEIEKKDKEFRESMEMTILYDQQLDAMVRSEIDIPEGQLRLFWDQLRLRVEPAPFGGVRVSLGFLKLPELRFALKYSAEQLFSVSDCDPLVIGLSELVDQLNADTRSGALARFICRIRARYTAQYLSSF